VRILKVLSSQAQPCGCLVGIYETYSGKVVQLVDFVGESCGRHRPGQQIEPGEASAHTPELSSTRPLD
jgi:hypothetical protein